MPDTIAHADPSLVDPLEDLRGCVPIWVPDPGDPAGLDGTWQLVDPESAQVDHKLAAQARAVAKLWSRSVLRNVA